ncbi:MAG: hypothetical protein HUJ27_00115 [Rhodobacteraceae bacterium]|nr:hypothetical protein [Paracoccaceae bacterium]
MLKKVWTDPVWSKVIATGIIAGVGVLITSLGGWWPEVIIAINDIWLFLVATTTVPNWFLSLLVICSLLMLGVLLIGVWSLFRSESQPSDLWRTYREDYFFGLRWRWDYGSDASHIYLLTAFCPHCDLQVHPVDIARYSGVNRYEYKCEDCNVNLKTFDMPIPQIEDKVIRQIQKKIRNEYLKNTPQQQM